MTKDKGKRREACKRYRLRHPERVHTASSKWQKTNPDKVANLRARRVARKYAAEGSHSAKEWKELKERCGNICVYCFWEYGIRKPVEDLTRDHFRPLSKGGDDYITNIVPCCQSCNSAKGSKTVAEFTEKVVKTILAREAKRYGQTV